MLFSVQHFKKNIRKRREKNEKKTERKIKKDTEGRLIKVFTLQMYIASAFNSLNSYNSNNCFLLRVLYINGITEV